MQKNLNLFVLTLLCCLGSGGCGAAADTPSDHSGSSGSSWWGFLAFLLFVLLPTVVTLVAIWLQKRDKRIAEFISEYPHLATILRSVRHLLGPTCLAYVEHPIVRFALRPFLFYMCFVFSGVISFSLFVGDRAANSGFLSFMAFTLWFILLFGFTCFSRWSKFYGYSRCWLYWRNGTVVGPFSMRQLIQLYSSEKLNSDTPVRQIKDSEWYVGVPLEGRPHRLLYGLLWGGLALIVGFPLCMGMFGHVKGRTLSVDQIFRELEPEEVGRLHGLTDQQMMNAGLIRVAAAVGEYVPNPFEDNAGRIGRALDEGFDMLTSRAEKAQNRTLGFTALIVLLAAAGGAASAPVPIQLIKERQMEVQRRTSLDENMPTNGTQGIAIGKDMDAMIMIIAIVAGATICIACLLAFMDAKKHSNALFKELESDGTNIR